MSDDLFRRNGNKELTKSYTQRNAVQLSRQAKTLQNALKGYYQFHLKKSKNV